MTQAIYEKATETAKKVRKELKKEFPEIKFSVTSERYSGGSSIHVNWTDGPFRSDVQKILDQFSSATFDGMDDSTNYHGYEYEGKRYMGADYIFSQRNLSDEYLEKIIKCGVEHFGDFQEYPTNIELVRAERVMLGLDPNVL